MTTLHPTPTEAADTLRRVAGIATEHGLHIDHDAAYTVCLCADGTHPRSEWAADAATKDGAVREMGYIAGPRHIVRRQRLTLTALTEVDPW